MTDTVTAEPAAPPVAEAPEPRPELRAAPPQITRLDTPYDVRDGMVSLNHRTGRAQTLIGGHWMLRDNLPEAETVLAEIAERALNLRRQLIVLRTTP